MKTKTLKTFIIALTLLPWTGTDARGNELRASLTESLRGYCIPKDEAGCGPDEMAQRTQRFDGKYMIWGCGCVPGRFYDRDNSRSCKLCQPGTYMNLFAPGFPTACTKCPDGSSSVEGATSPSQCDCPDGYDWWPENGIADNTLGECKPASQRPFSYRRVVYKEVE
jgi:hypothetical protein